MGYKVAVVGASGNVGREMLATLHERKFPVSEVVALASSRSTGKQVSFGDDDLTIHDLAKFDFKGVDIVLSSPGSKVSAEFAPKAAAAGAVVIDNTSFSAWTRMCRWWCRRSIRKRLRAIQSATSSLTPIVPPFKWLWR
jgi:aspartate-semialdehyde dehydrogenase